MKKLLILAIIGLGLNFTNAQTKTCYEEYIDVFDERGAYEVKDGEYDDIIITVKKGPQADCFVGYAVVSGGNIVDIYIKYADGTKGKFVKEYKNKEESWGIFRGVSKTRLTKDDELINVFFVQNIKPKKKELMRAPKPNFD